VRPAGARPQADQSRAQDERTEAGGTRSPANAVAALLAQE
jgi:hypothetical protein